MLMSPMILRREITGAWSWRGTFMTSWVTPSTRKRTRRLPPVGSRWMSEARSCTARVRSSLTNCTTGASAVVSATPPGRSSSSSSSLASCSMASASAPPRHTPSRAFMSWRSSAMTGRTGTPLMVRRSSRVNTSDGFTMATTRRSSSQAMGTALLRRAKGSGMRRAAVGSRMRSLRSTKSTPEAAARAWTSWISVMTPSSTRMRPMRSPVARWASRAASSSSSVTEPCMIRTWPSLGRPMARVPAKRPGRGEAWSERASAVSGSGGGGLRSMVSMLAFRPIGCQRHGVGRLSLLTNGAAGPFLRDVDTVGS